MAAGNIRNEGHTLNDLTFGEVLKGNGHVVGRVYLDVFHQKLK